MILRNQIPKTRIRRQSQRRQTAKRSRQSKSQTQKLMTLLPGKTIHLLQKQTSSHWH
jgi:hypothetical protein